MGDLVINLIAGLLELVVWVVWKVLPAICYFTGLALVFLATLGRVTVELPENLDHIRWTGLSWVKRSPQGRTILSPALGVVIGFAFWGIIASALTIYLCG
jgi:hypothetical protein